MQRLKVHYGIDPVGKGKFAFYWPESDQKRGEVRAVKRGEPMTFESTYQCRPGNRIGSIFTQSDFAYYIPPDNLCLGRAVPTVQAFIARGHSVGQAWDTASKDTATSAHTVCITGLLIPCNKYHCGEDPAVEGPCEDHFDVLILDVFRDKVGWGGLTAAFKIETRKWSPDVSLVEDKSSGIALIQNLRSAGAPIQEVKAEEGKRQRAVNGIGGGAGSVQGWFRLHRVLFPIETPDSPCPWLRALETELKDFSGEDDASSDQVDALVHLVTYAIKLGAGGAVLPSDWTPERGTPNSTDMLMPGDYVGEHGDRRAQFLTMLGELPSLVSDPFYGFCGTCQEYLGSWCRRHGMNKVSLDTCELYVERGPG